MAEAAIKTIRVRNSDGTYSDPVPIGADSNNITVLADGSTLSDVLGAVNVTKYGSIQEQLGETSKEKGSIQYQLDTLLARIEALEDQIAAQ